MPNHGIFGDDEFGSYKVEESYVDDQGNWKCKHIYSYGSQPRSWHTIFQDGAHYFQNPDGTQAYYHPDRPGSGWLRDFNSGPKRSWRYPDSPCAFDFNPPPSWWVEENLKDGQLSGASGSYSRSEHVEISYEEYRSERVSFETHSSETFDDNDYSEDDPYTDYDSEDDMESLREASPSPPPYEPAAIDLPVETGYVAYVDPPNYASRNDTTGKPRVKQTARKSAGRGSITTGQTTRKQVARKPSAKKPQSSEKKAESKTQGGRKQVAGISKKSKREKPKGASQTASVKFETQINDQQLQCRIEIGSACTKY